MIPKTLEAADFSRVEPNPGDGRDSTAAEELRVLLDNFLQDGSCQYDGKAFRRDRCRGARDRVREGGADGRRWR